MAEIHLVTVVVATGQVTSEWRGDSASLPPTQPGRAFVEVTGQPAQDYRTKRWTGSAWEAATPPLLRVLSPIEFSRRFGDTELVAVDNASQLPTDAGARIRVALRKMSLATTVNLDHPDVDKYLLLLKNAGILNDTRIAQIKA